MKPETIRLRAATTADLAFILTTEAEARDGGFVGGWTETEHRAALSDADVGYFVVEAAGYERPIGYVILRGLRDANGAVELKRIAVAAAERGRGFGRQILRFVKQLAFDELHAHRLWLDVFTHNARARHLYRSESLVEEGVLRECYRTDAVEGGYASLVVMSILEPEYREQRNESSTTWPADVTGR